MSSMHVTPIPDIGAINKRDAVTRNYADAITRTEGLGLQLARQFQKLEELQAQMVEVGIRTEAILEPHVQAALTEWQAGRAGEVPIGPPLP